MSAFPYASEEQLRAAGISSANVIDPAAITFGQEIRDICARNACGNYDRTWACPPAQGSVEECRARVLAYGHALVFQTVYPLEDSYDYEGMMEGHASFKKVCDALFDTVTTAGLRGFLLLSNEGCGRCTKCAWPDSPCRFPERLFPALEGFGIYVNKLAESAGMRYINGANTVTYFGMLLYD